MKYAAYTGTRNMYKDMLPSVKSLLSHVDDVTVFFLIEDDVFPYPLPNEVRTINVSDQKFFYPNGPNMNSQFTYMAMMRIAMCYVLPQDIDRVLVMDSDVIINDDISELWQLNLDDYYFAAAPESHRCYYGLLYCNTGVAMYNLDKLRDGKAQEIINVLNLRKYTWVEQDVNNYLCQGRILEMDGNYNANDWTAHGDNPKVIHFAGHGDWTEMDIVKRWADKPWPEGLTWDDNQKRGS